MKNKSILVLDNYDSFTYNLVHIIKALGYTNVEVHRNDKITLEEIERFDKILLSPGPGIPSEAGILQQVIKTYAGKKSIFGVCLGHQAIGEVFGGTLINLEKVYHGIATKTSILNKGDLKNKMKEMEILFLKFLGSTFVSISPLFFLFVSFP